MSCQTTHQLTRFAAEYPTLCSHTKAPFDWLICPLGALVPWLEDGIKDFNQAEIIVERDHAYWPKHGMWFWHWFYRHEGDQRILDIKGTLERELSKLQNLRQRFFNCDPANTIFVFSNVQNNLQDEVFAKDEEPSYVLDALKMEQLESALARYFGSPANIQWISRSDRIDISADHLDNVHILPPESSQWKGCDADWDAVLRAIL